ncbi:MAG: ABC transporter permease [Chromatiales bacterium]|nr:ABC transporter permease [Chromatiales bacterium]
MTTYFIRSVAFRHLRYSVGQSLLTIGVVGISVLLIIYLRTIIGGTQTRIVQNTTGAIPHITVEPPERTPVGAWQLANLGIDPDTLYVGEVVNLPKARESIEDWRLWLPSLDGADPAVTAVSPIVTGQAFMNRGSRRQSVRLAGVIPERHNGIVEIEKSLVSGRFIGMSPGDIVLGRKLATDFGLKLRDKVRLVGPEGLTLNFTVAGIYNTGFGQVDDGQVFVTLRDGQSLLELGGSISSFGIKLADLYAAENIARRIAPGLPFKVRSWVVDNPNLFVTLASQGQTRDLILIMTTIASGFGIGSILVMVVTSKYREIGILKAMGATPGEIQSIFVLEGLLLAFLGCLAGVPLGVVLLKALAAIRSVGPDGRVGSPFLIEIDPVLLVGASLVAIVTGAIASYFPARRAGQVDPIQVIRGS